MPQKPPPQSGTKGQSPVTDAQWFPTRAQHNEQVFKLKLLYERYLQHLQDLYHVFIDFKKAFDKVWLAALWAAIELYNINANLTRIIESLDNKATSAVYFKGSKGEWFRITFGVRQGCLLSPTLFTIFLQRIMTDAFEEHDGKNSQH
ncbi:LINE-1 retrotransposable element orf2 protein [Plakobranchus ocellatus]|uniref:LINE-1 retrotransposable element orf2 protein n=1 Tax=Plakobranchus ocellatus TaxID=259542 RepID=A0AAV4DGM4_9GAST|nr:LINE-1 retrotransposable element orf2 protein [Plakobranchus ocellatus]